MLQKYKKINTRVIGFIIFIMILIYFDFNSLLTILMISELRYIFILIPLNLIFFFFKTFRWINLLRSSGIKISLFYAYVTYYAGLDYNINNYKVEFII